MHTIANRPPSRRWACEIIWLATSLPTTINLTRGDALVLEFCGVLVDCKGHDLKGLLVRCEGGVGLVQTGCVLGVFEVLLLSGALSLVLLGLLLVGTLCRLLR